MTPKAKEAIDGKTVLITGGTGSFGRAIVRRALSVFSPRRVIVFSRDELKQHEMRVQIKDPRLDFFLGNVRECDRLRRAFQANVDVVIHAAALKQVEICEYNPFEAIKTNILGAKNVIDAAIDCGIPKVIALSTDKAVNPVNLYGATKLCAEKLFVQGNSYAGGRNTRFSCVRYGNVLASRGSLLPLLRAQKAQGKVTVTDPRMTRFWLTLDQALDFVTRCIVIMRGGEVFVPHIPSMKVIDMVGAVAPGCQIEYTGIRPGEKLHETLISRDESRHTFAFDDMFVIKPEYALWGASQALKGTPLPDDFLFASDTNDRWLSQEELLTLLEESENASKSSPLGG